MEFNELKNYKYIEMNSINEIEFNQLRILINVCKTSISTQNIQLGNLTIKNVNEIEVDQDEPTIQIDFKSYITYMISNESNISSETEEASESSTFSKSYSSYLLDYIKEKRLISAELQGTLIHYKINCLNHIIDIISDDEPLINEMDNQKK